MRGKRVHDGPAEGQAADEAILVQRAIGHDADAFGKLYDMHVDRVYRHVLYRVGNEPDAEDLTQQVFLKAWQAIGRYRRAASPFVAWLMTISHNLVVDFYRTRKEKAYLEVEALADDGASNPERKAEDKSEQERLRNAILQLRGDEQQVVILRFIEGLEYSEIASLLKKSEGNVRVILHRALVKLRKIAAKEEEET
jgi:RNA polymerase sigma-70 factor, ECF subfamily